jgi:hypothetical protein
MLAEYGLAPTLRTVLQAWSGAAVRAKHFEAWHDGTKRTDEPGRYSHQQKPSPKKRELSRFKSLIFP